MSTTVLPTSAPSASASALLSAPLSASSSSPPTSDPASVRRGHCMTDSLICCYNACDYHDFVFGCVSTGDSFGCCRTASCCAVGYDSLGCGQVTNPQRKECIKFGCLCCECGIIQPTTVCFRCASQCGCCQSVASLPFHPDYVNHVVCGFCCVQCCPQFGYCVAPPVAPAFTILKHTQFYAAEAATEMERT